MRITLINPSQHTPYPQPPIGLALLAAICERENHNVQIMDLNIGNSEKFPFAQSDLIGITAMTTTANEVAGILEDLKWLACKKVVGGVHATIVKDFKFADHIVIGEGDNFLKYLSERIVCPPQVDNLDNLPFPAYHLLPMHKYKPHAPHGKYGRWMPMTTSRGCPYRCSFCSKAVFGNRYRHMNPRRIVEEIQFYMHVYDVKEICFYDDVFTVNHSHVIDLLKLLAPLKVKWSCETRVNLIDPPLLKFMKDAGCYSISYGLESGSQSVLSKISKDVTVKQNEDAIQMTHDAGIESVGYFMIGSPWETAKDILETIDFACRIPLDYAQFAITTPLPGSQLYDIWRMSHSNMNWDNFRYDGFVSSPCFDQQFSREDLEQLKSMAYRKFYIRPEYIWKKVLGLKSLADFKVAFDGVRMLLERK